MGRDVVATAGEKKIEVELPFPCLALLCSRVRDSMTLDG